MKNERFSRRAILRSLGVGAAFLPLLGSEKAPAQTASGFPKRLVTVTWCNGLVPDDFYPAGNEITIGETLASLEPWKDKLIIIEGLDCKVMSDYPDRKWDGHYTYPTLLTGTADPGFEVSRALGPSIDQFISDEIAKTVNLPVPLINIGVRSPDDRDPTSWRGKDQPNTPESDPQRLFDKLFSGATMPVETIDALRLRRQSVLDFVGRELEGFGKNLGSEDRFKIDSHLQSIRELEKRLQSNAAPGAGCMPPALTQGDDTPTLMKNMFDLAAAALICDCTRVINIDLYSNGGGDGNSFSWLDINRDYHTVAHDGSAAYDEKRKIDAWLFSQVAGLVQQLASTVEGEQTALDNSVILIANDMEEGASHSVDHIPFALIGSSGGYLKTGQALNLGGEAHNLLLATVCNAMDVPVTGYGENYSGTIPQIVA
ncbi:MAG TPA: DUF1552 domain-containing protein [Polyangiaceae bacterium]|nr:DUF1552 domain-containing protein [Polyangiaceae bacterium]